MLRVLQNHGKTKEIFSFVFISKSIFVSSDSFCLITLTNYDVIVMSHNICPFLSEMLIYIKTMITIISLGQAEHVLEDHIENLAVGVAVEDQCAQPDDHGLFLHCQVQQASNLQEKQNLQTVYIHSQILMNPLGWPIYGVTLWLLHVGVTMQ